MKKITLAGLAVLVIASCTKNEIVEDSISQEISYQTLSTKATVRAFSESNHFFSYAYFLENPKTWDANKADASMYISNSEISFNTTEKAWKNASTVYYWPKQGKLTFFSWTDNTSAPAVTGTTVSCTTDGIKVASYDITKNPNKDLLVADIAKDQEKNTKDVTGTSGAWKTGVPTLFHHIQSALVFNAKTDKDYSASATFNVKSITLKQVETTRTYNQGGTSVWTSETTPVKNDISVATNATDASYTVTSTEKQLVPATDDYTIVLPQDLTSTDQLIVIEYTIKTNYGVEMTQNCTITKKLSEVYTNNWEPGKKYTLTLTFTLDEILWAPEVEDWEVGTVTGITA